MKEENEKNLQSLIELSDKIEKEKEILSSISKNFPSPADRLQKIEFAEKNYENQKSQQIVGQNSINNKIIMLVNERTRIKDLISNEVNQVKILSEELEAVKKEVSEFQNMDKKRKENLEEMRKKIAAEREKIDKINFGAKVRILSCLNPTLDNEFSNQKLLEDFIKTRKMDAKNKEKYETLEKMLNDYKTKNPLEIFGEDAVQKYQKIQQKINTSITHTEKIKENLSKKSTEYAQKLSIMIQKVSEPIKTEQKIEKNNIKDKIENSQSALESEQRIKDWLSKVKN